MTDMTSGKPVSTVIRFAIPLMAASIIQQMYALTDAMVLGIYGGNQSLAVLGFRSVRLAIWDRQPAFWRPFALAAEMKKN